MAASQLIYLTLVVVAIHKGNVSGIDPGILATKYKVYGARSIVISHAPSRLHTQSM